MEEGSRIRKKDPSVYYMHPQTIVIHVYTYILHFVIEEKKKKTS